MESGTVVLNRVADRKEQESRSPRRYTMFLRQFATALITIQVVGKIGGSLMRISAPVSTSSSLPKKARDLHYSQARSICQAVWNLPSRGHSFGAHPSGAKSAGYPREPIIARQLSHRAYLAPDWAKSKPSSPLVSPSPVQVQVAPWREAG